MAKKFKDNMKVAVYGTLRKGFGNHRLLETSKYVATINSPKEFLMKNVGFFPALLDKESLINSREEANSSVVMEIYEIPSNQVLQRLDGLEGFRESYPKSSMYLRKTINLPEHGEVETYIWNRSHSTLEVIKSGDFKNR